MPEQPSDAVPVGPDELTEEDVRFLERLDEERTELVFRRMHPDVLRTTTWMQRLDEPGGPPDQPPIPSPS